ncbi:tRNA-dihydrouridine synthase, partial [Globicatella sulfidifaciens]
MFKIGNIQIDNPIVVAPMAGVSNSAFRTIVKQFGAGLVVCEMISDKGIQFRNEKTLSMLHIAENEYPLSIQIMGGNRETLVEAAKYVAENTECAIIDINMGCPVNKVIKAEAGARWLLDPNKVYEMVSSVVDAVDKPVTVKMRTGWDDEHLYAIENALAAERAGASMVAMHGRTRVQMYEGKA